MAATCTYMGTGVFCGQPAVVLIAIEPTRERSVRVCTDHVAEMADVMEATRGHLADAEWVSLHLITPTGGIGPRVELALEPPQ